MINVNKAKKGEHLEREGAWNVDEVEKAVAANVKRQGDCNCSSLEREQGS